MRERPRHAADLARDRIDLLRHREQELRTEAVGSERKARLAKS